MLIVAALVENWHLYIVVLLSMERKWARKPQRQRSDSLKIFSSHFWGDHSSEFVVGEDWLTNLGGSQERSTYARSIRFLLAASSVHLMCSGAVEVSRFGVKLYGHEVWAFYDGTEC